jgi:predicted short-subunit dehydrogenase-like oxidoreductase (DUF2520 family)
MSRQRLSVGVLGAGNAAHALIAVWRRRSDLRLSVWARRVPAKRRLAERHAVIAERTLEELVFNNSVLVLAVRDDALFEAARMLEVPIARVARPRAILHLAGARSASLPLGALRRLGCAVGVLHPMLPLTDLATTRGAVASISGDAPALRIAKRLARAAGLIPQRVQDDRRDLLHLACVLAAGDLVALLDTAATWLHQAGMPIATARRAVAALAQNATRGFAGLGAERALSGPIVRADISTLVLHRVALRQNGLDHAPGAAAHRALAAVSLAIARRAGRIDAQTAHQIELALDLPPAQAARTLRTARTRRARGSKR